MKKAKKIFTAAFLVILSLIFALIVSDYLFKEEDKKPKYKISYISGTESREDLRFITEGIEQGAKDMNIEVNMAFLIDGTLEEQNKVLESEIKKGVDGIIISPIDGKSTEDFMKNVDKNIPVLLINSKITSGKNLYNISSDNYSIGKSLGEEVLRRGNTRKNIILLEDDLNFHTLDEMKKGFIDEMNYSKNKVINVKVSDDTEEIKNKLRKNNDDVIVAFNEKLLEELGKEKKELIEEGFPIKNEIYGVGRTSKILSYVEDEIIHGIIVENEFNIGYLSVERILNKLKNKYPKEKNIDFSVINNRNMYSDENQKLLFPFVK